MQYDIIENLKIGASIWVETENGICRVTKDYDDLFRWSDEVERIRNNSSSFCSVIHSGNSRLLEECLSDNHGVCWDKIELIENILYDCHLDNTEVVYSFIKENWIEEQYLKEDEIKNVIEELLKNVNLSNFLIETGLEEKYISMMFKWMCDQGVHIVPFVVKPNWYREAILEESSFELCTGAFYFDNTKQELSESTIESKLFGLSMDIEEINVYLTKDYYLMKIEYLNDDGKLDSNSTIYHGLIEEGYLDDCLKSEIGDFHPIVVETVFRKVEG